MGNFKDKHGKTMVQAFLGHAKNVAPDILDAAGKLTGIDALENLAKMIEKDPNMSEEDKTIALEMIKLERADMADARNMNVRIQESENASWLAKNTAYILDFSIFTLAMFMVIGLFFVEIPERNERILDITTGTVLGILGTTYAFHRGSSKSSEDKTKEMQKIMRGK
jgi:Icc-related predicted phosphoesterase